MAVPISELQSLSPTAIIELYRLELNTLLHGSNQVFLFHSLRYYDQFVLQKLNDFETQKRISSNKEYDH